MKNTLFVTEILRKIKKYQNLSLKYVVFKKKYYLCTLKK